MKGNHKNKPVAKDYANLMDYVIAWEIWAQTQEKELREKLKHPPYIENLYDVRQFIKEILGES